MYRSKRIYLNKKNTWYCIVKLFSSKKEMQTYYESYDIKRGVKDSGHYKVLGVSLHYEIHKGKKLMPETGMVFLNVENSGAGIVAHELLHAVLYAHKFKKYKVQYPIVIKNMREEEIILHNHTYAINQFYKWYWKVVEEIKK